MNCPPFIREALSQFAVCIEDGGRIAVPTPCLYPSNGVVTVFVSGGARECVVSDRGGAIAEIAAHGLEIPNIEPYLRPFCVPRGLRISGTEIHTPPIPGDSLATAISLVATASSLAAFWAVRTFRHRVRRDLRRELRELLEARFSPGHVKEEIHLDGLSGRSYRFEFLVDIGGSRQLVLDSIFPEATAINTRTIAHFDLAQNKNPVFVQRLVYDQADDWAASDLNLLQMAAELVPFTSFSQNLDSMRLP
jgi:hypothetical protein